MMLTDTKRNGMPKIAAVLGATGSVGRQALDVARHADIRVDLLSANRDAAGMEALAREFLPTYCVMADEAAAKDLRLRLADTEVCVLGGASDLTESIAMSKAETVVNAVLGAAGLAPTLATIDAGKRLALSNKESLVVAGELVMGRAREKKAEIIPVDSEHSAIFQSLQAGRASEVRNLWLTASGGPFFGKSRAELASVTLQQTLAHPTWKMGAKITVDSADMMNKGFEVIEAVHLFGVKPSQVRVVVHRESIIHSAVEYIDGAVIAEMSLPDMRMCVQYAMSYPERASGVCAPLDLATMGELHFAAPDSENFPLLPLAYRAVLAGGALPAVLNAANEVAVAAFLSEKLSFLGIGELVGETVEKLSFSQNEHTLEGILNYDTEARREAAALLSKNKG